MAQWIQSPPKSHFLRGGIEGVKTSFFYDYLLNYELYEKLLNKTFKDHWFFTHFDSDNMYTNIFSITYHYFNFIRWMYFFYLKFNTEFFNWYKYKKSIKCSWCGMIWDIKLQMAIWNTDVNIHKLCSVHSHM